MKTKTAPKTSAAPVKTTKTKTAPPTPVVVRQASSTPRDAFGGRLNTRGHVVNVAALTLGAGGKEFTTKDVEAFIADPKNKLAQAYKALAGQLPQAVYAHLRGCEYRGFNADGTRKPPHVVTTANGWKLAPQHLKSGKPVKKGK